MRRGKQGYSNYSNIWCWMLGQWDHTAIILFVLFINRIRWLRSDYATIFDQSIRVELLWGVTVEQIEHTSLASDWSSRTCNNFSVSHFTHCKGSICSLGHERLFNTCYANMSKQDTDDCGLSTCKNLKVNNMQKKNTSDHYKYQAHKREPGRDTATWTKQSSSSRECKHEDMINVTMHLHTQHGVWTRLKWQAKRAHYCTYTQL